MPVSLNRKLSDEIRESMFDGVLAQKVSLRKTSEDASELETKAVASSTQQMNVTYAS